MLKVGKSITQKWIVEGFSLACLYFMKVLTIVEFDFLTWFI